MKLLITGASGLYGSKLAKIATSKQHLVYSGYNQDQPPCGIPIQFDVSKKRDVEEALRIAEPEVVVHAASLTDVDKCETNKELARTINVEGTKNISRAAKEHGSFLIYISSDYVFNGEKGQYRESDNPDPTNYYGFTKLEAEKTVKNTFHEYCIARASVIYGSNPAAGKINFALWLLNKLRENEQVRIVTDQWNSPTLNTNMAEMTLEIIERRLAGTFHISGKTRISRYDFAKQIAKKFGLNQNLILPATSEEFSWAAKRPKDSSLNTSKAIKTLKKQPLPISQALARMKQEFMQ